MDVFYVDESCNRGERSSLSQKLVVSCLRVAAEYYAEAFALLKEFRKRIRDEYGVRVDEELHGVQLLGGRGKYTNVGRLGRRKTLSILRKHLDAIASLPGCQIINVSLNAADGWKATEEKAYDRLFNRIQTHLRHRNRYGIIIFDRGKEYKTTRVSRRLKVFNYVPSFFGEWVGGQRARNIITDRIIEDPFFKDSRDSFFIQAVDTVAISLLRFDAPTPAQRTAGIDQFFPILRRVLCYEAAKLSGDPNGVVRQ